MIEEYLLIKDKLEINKDEKLNNIKRIYKEKIENMNESESLKKYFIWEYELFILAENIMHIEKYKKENRLIPHLIYTNGTQYPDILNFEKERIEFYNNCLSSTQNVAMKLRYLEYLVDYGDKDNKYVYAKELVEFLLKDLIIKDYKNPSLSLSYISRLSRAIDISVSFKMKEKIKEVEQQSITEIEKLLDLNEYRWILEISELLRYLCYNKKDKRISQGSINYIIKALDVSKEHYKEEKNMNLHQGFCYEFYNWIKKEDNDNQRKNEILLEIGKAYEVEAEHQGGRPEKSYQVKAYFLECAVNHYVNIGARDKVHELKVKIKEAYRLGKEQVQEHSFNIDIPNHELIERDADRFILESIEDSFKLFSRINCFTPKIEDITKTVKSRQKNPLMNLIGISKIAGDRKIFDVNSDEEREKYFIYEEYNMWIQMMFSIMYDKVWIKLVDQGLTCDMVVERINNWEYMGEEDTEIIKRGIERYFEDDFISAIHILTPKFESCFREFFVWGGYATTSIKSSSIQHEQNFNDFIRNSFVKQHIDKDILFLIRYIMVDDLGYNLRNDIAHGLAGKDKFNRNIANMIIYLFFILTNLYWETNTSS